jgi:fumarylacetoacetase
MPQQLAHLTSNGSTIRTGDLMGTGTISGAGPGSLLELRRNERYLADGDEVVLRARGHGIELGEVRGRVVPA